VNDYGRNQSNIEEQVRNLRARIAALRSRIGLGIESFEDAQASGVQHTPERPKEEKRVEQKVEPDWNAINRLKAINDAKEVKDAEMNALKSKLKPR
tara:strand:- start:173 stop:460 length:288 start_codon:yes stop_codon:yes gene_type:complete